MADDLVQEDVVEVLTHCI